MVLSGVWLIGTAYFAYPIFSIQKPFADDFVYLHEMKSDQPNDPTAVDWSRPYYEIFKSPSQERLKPTFAVEHDKHVKSGLDVVTFPDGARLYLVTAMTMEDRQYLARQFDEQGWSRHVTKILPWIAAAFGVPLGALALGFITLWVGRGFTAKTDVQ